MNRIILETPMSVMEGANTVYLLRRGGDIALVDAGSPSAAVWEALTDGLAEHDVAPEDLDAILLTHGHPDHSGLAGALQQASGATVYLHEGDHHYLEGDDQAQTQAEERAQFDGWGVPSATRDRIFRSMEGVDESTDDDFTRPESIESVDDGQVIRVGDLAIDVLHTPGHSSGSVVYAFDGETGREAFTGDTLLPKYTPNIGVDPRVDNPLARYFEALNMLGRSLSTAWPGHRSAITDPAARANAIVEHHRDRLTAVLAALGERDAATVWEVAEALFDDLQGVHAMLGAAEVEAHLRYLEGEGHVERTDGTYRAIRDRGEGLDGVDRYRV